MGYSPGLGFIHTGNHLSFVYDLADLYKLEIAVPAAFASAAQGSEDIERRVRLAIRDRFRESRFVVRVSQDLASLFQDELEPEPADGDAWEGFDPGGES